MRLEDLVKPLDKMNDEELLERLRFIRNNRSVVRPAAAKHVERAQNKVTKTKVTKTKSLFENLSDAEKEQLLKQLQSEV